MPTKGNPRFNVRLTIEERDDFYAATAKIGNEASSVLRDFIRWFNGYADTPLPVPARMRHEEDDEFGTDVTPTFITPRELGQDEKKEYIGE